ncbi:MAG TPA: flagellar export chaperone FlgN [Thermoleophilaceae bacterium]|nr:flagellar export chaperone FlgN [Thermoleophilaceae bacterium]
MSARALPAGGQSPFERDVLEHLDAQIESARRLLGSILGQGAAIRERDVEGVLARLGDIKTEMDLRAKLESERTDLLIRAGAKLGVPPAAVTLEAMTSLMAPAAAEHARESSAELRGLLDEVAREHGINRALMRQELAFLDHLVRLLGREPDAGYRPTGPAPQPASHHVLNLQA